MPNKDLIGIALISTIVMGAYFYQRNLKARITELELANKGTQIQLANSKLESVRLKNSLDKQNKHIEQLEASKKLSLAKLQKWKNKKPEVKYKTIETIREVQSNDCKDIKDTIDAVSNIDFKLL